MPNNTDVNLNESPNINFTSDLLNWYQTHARSLPWRATKDPYKIWVSEVMLQQTRVETVISYYHRFLEQFPTLTSLASAPEQSVLKAWEGLGYYRRARLLHQGAQSVIRDFGGNLPADPGLLLIIPGVGPYMAGALASIAFNLPSPAVDGNVIRVVTRILAWDEDASTARSLQIITQWVKEHFPPARAGDFTQSLMELGALICLPRNPDCRECPVRFHCRAKDCEGGPARYPIKKAARAIPAERRVILRITWDGRHLLSRRPETGLLAGLWEYPNLLVKHGEDALDLARCWTRKQFGKILEFQPLTTMNQVFSHRRWDLEIWDTWWPETEAPKIPPNSGWFLPDEEKQLPRVAFVRTLEPGEFTGK